MHWFSTADEVKHFELKGGFLQPVMSKDKKYKLLNFFHNMERLRAKKFYFYVPDTEETKNENHLIKRSWLIPFWTHTHYDFSICKQSIWLAKGFVTSLYFVLLHLLSFFRHFTVMTEQNRLKRMQPLAL